MVEKILKDIKQINELCIKHNFEIELVVVGGSAFVLSGMISRSTHDIDFINVIDQENYLILKKELKELDIDLNNKMRIYKHHFVGWENETILIESLSNVALKTLSKEMLIASKFFTRVEDRDITDAAYNGIALSKDKLENIIKNIWDSSVSVVKHRLVARSMEIVEFYKAMGWDYENSIIKNFCNWKVQ